MVLLLWLAPAPWRRGSWARWVLTCRGGACRACHILLSDREIEGPVGQADSGGILTAYEAAGLDLAGTRLVVLSACDTGTGLRSRGQEVQGLRWGFRASGATALVTSLWRSNDAATRRLMRSFYAALAKPTNGRRVDLFGGVSALRDAQLERVADDKRLGVARPLIWAN